MKQIILQSEKEMTSLASKIATQAQLGECYYLVGDLGAGKTCFARGFIQSLGIIEDVTSPTYSLINSYSAVLGDIHHLDLYRLTDDVDYCQSGLDDTDTDNSIWLIEWPQRCPDSIPRATHTLTFLCQDSVHSIEISEQLFARINTAA